MLLERGKTASLSVGEVNSQPSTVLGAKKLVEKEKEGRSHLRFHFHLFEYSWWNAVLACCSTRIQLGFSITLKSSSKIVTERTTGEQRLLVHETVNRLKLRKLKEVTCATQQRMEQKRKRGGNGQHD